MVMRVVPLRVRARVRARQRGATLFMVVLVMTLLMGIGAFAARSAHLATASSGYVRQQTQARYLGDYAMVLLAAMTSGAAGQGYASKLGLPPDFNGDLCTGQTNLSAKSCLKLTATEVQAALGSALKLCEPPGSGMSYPGSLGNTDAECFFGVEITDKAQGPTPAGYDTSAKGVQHFFYATATTTAQVRLAKTSYLNNQTIAAAAIGASGSTQTLRARLILGPYPPN